MILNMKLPKYSDVNQLETLSGHDSEVTELALERTSQNDMNAPDRIVVLMSSTPSDQLL